MNTHTHLSLIRSGALPVYSRLVFCAALILSPIPLQAQQGDDAYAPVPFVGREKATEEPIYPREAIRSYTNNTYGDRDSTHPTDSSIVEYYKQRARAAAARHGGYSTYVRRSVLLDEPPYYARNQEATPTDTSLISYYREKAKVSSSQNNSETDQKIEKKSSSALPRSHNPSYVAVEYPRSYGWRGQGYSPWGWGGAGYGPWCNPWAGPSWGLRGGWNGYYGSGWGLRGNWNRGGNWNRRGNWNRGGNWNRRGNWNRGGNWNNRGNWNRGGNGNRRAFGNKSHRKGGKGGRVKQGGHTPSRPNQRGMRSDRGR